MSAPGPVSEMVVVAEQLRRRIGGGISTYTEGLLAGLGALPADLRPGVRLHASRARPGAPDPLARFGFPVVASPLPGPLLVRAWDVGLLRAPRSCLTHAVSLAAPASGSPLVVTIHDLGWRITPLAYPERGRRWHEAALRRALRRAAAFVVPSAETAGSLVEAAPALTGRRLVPGEVTVIEEGSDHLPPPDLAGAARLLERIGAAGEPGYLLAVGTLEPRKNLPRLLAAYEQARRTLGEGWRLVVVGPPGWGPALAGVPHGVLLAGEVPAAVLAGLYAGARCLAYVPLVEGFGLPVVEAMRAGIPVVSSPVPSAGAASLLVDPTDVEQIAAALTVAVSDEGRRAELVAAGRARVSRATWERAARAHAELWASLATSRRG